MSMHTSEPRKKFTVGIVGGGIAGLAFAIALAKAGADVEVDIYESTSSFSEVGAGLGMWPRVWDSMKLLGLEEDMKARASSFAGGGRLLYRKSDQSEPVILGHSEMPLQSFHRADFLHVLLLHAPAHFRTHFGKRLVSYIDCAPDPVLLQFKDGTSASCDILVGADGVKSAVRRTMFTRLAEQELHSGKAKSYLACIDPTWTGMVAYRSLVAKADLEAECPSHVSLQTPIYCIGKDKSIISYPISQGRIINCATLQYWPELRNTTYPGPWVCHVDQQEMLNDFTGWESEVTSLLKAMKQVSKWAIHTVERLPTYVSGRVAIMGDAAHAMAPHMASGAGQGIEDGLVLAALLAQPETQTATIVQALQVYDEAWRPFSQHVQGISFRLGEIYWLETPERKHFTAEESAAGRVPLEELQALHAEVVDIQRWTCTTSLGSERELAVEKLKTLLK